MKSNLQQLFDGNIPHAKNKARYIPALYGLNHNSGNKCFNIIYWCINKNANVTIMFLKINAWSRIVAEIIIYQVYDKKVYKTAIIL